MYEEILDFWFEEIESSYWWKKDEAFDQLIRERFSSVHKQALSCELSFWRKTARGRLAEVIVLDQFSRNMFRDLPGAFASDSLALALAQEAVAQGCDRELAPNEVSFLYMPYMHSESALIHEQAVSLFERSGNDSTLRFEMRHKEIIDKFGRYPHRNTILGRESTNEELAFLAKPGSSF